jgi:hypothetical protein
MDTGDPGKKLSGGYLVNTDGNPIVRTLRKVLLS